MQKSAPSSIDLQLCHLWRSPFPNRHNLPAPEGGSSLCSWNKYNSPRSTSSILYSLSSSPLHLFRVYSAKQFAAPFPIHPSSIQSVVPRRLVESKPIPPYSPSSGKGFVDGYAEQISVFTVHIPSSVVYPQAIRPSFVPEVRIPPPLITLWPLWFFWNLRSLKPLNPLKHLRSLRSPSFCIPQFLPLGAILGMKYTLPKEAAPCLSENV